MLVRSGRERQLTLDLLAREGHAARACSDIAELCERFQSHDAGAALVVGELLSPHAVEQIAQVLAGQPAWSDFPFVVFGTPPTPEAHQNILLLGNVTFLDRPVHVRTMLAAIRAAMRSRVRQHEARQAIESRDAFLAMLGHELRNPLGAIRLAMTIHAANVAPQPLSRELVVIDRQSTHLAHLVDDLLDVARVTNGKINLVREALDVGATLRAAVDILTPRAQDAGLQLSLELPTTPVFVSADRQRLEQVLSNVVGNAIKYTPRGGRVRMTVTADERVHIAVTDTGVGISPEMLPRVFDAFAQADRSLDRADGGIGLGLALVKNLVELNDGTVQASSDGLGKGSTFTIDLPRARVSTADDDTQSSVRIALSRKRIVVVEDGDDNRELLTDLLASAGHEITAAADGPAGLAEILAADPDVAFVDIGLPGFDGFEVARRVRSEGRTLRLVALTGYGQADDLQRALDAGFDEHLTKPVTSAQLNAAIARAGTDSERSAAGSAARSRG